MIHRARSLAVVLALGIPSIAAAQPKQVADPVSTFLQQDKYTYCDVKILSALWKVSIQDGKANVGAKLQQKNEKYLQTQLTNARAAAVKSPKNRCTFAEAGFSFDDQKKLAKLWKKTEADAKALAEEKILNLGEKYVHELLGHSTGGGSSDDPTSVYLKQDKFTYCDVKQLSAMWKTSIDDGKARVGLKIQTKNAAYLETELQKARTGKPARCNYMEAGLSFADVEKLAKMWKMSVGKAKVKIEQKVTMSGTSFLREQLGGPGTHKQAELDAFFAQTKYTYCDAAMIGAMWKQSVEDGKTFIGLKLTVKNTPALDKVIADARAAAAKNPVKGCEQVKAPPPPVGPPPAKPPAGPPPGKAPAPTKAPAPPPAKT